MILFRVVVIHSEEKSFLSELKVNNNKVNKFSRQDKDKEIFGSIFPCATLGANKVEVDKALTSLSE